MEARMRPGQNPTIYQTGRVEESVTKKEAVQSIGGKSPLPQMTAKDKVVDGTGSFREVREDEA